MIAIFQNIECLNSIGEALPSGLTIGQPSISQDGRVAIAHSFTEEDLEVLQLHNAVLVEELPIDW